MFKFKMKIVIILCLIITITLIIYYYQKTNNSQQKKNNDKTEISKDQIIYKDNIKKMGEIQSIKNNNIT